MKNSTIVLISIVILFICGCSQTSTSKDFMEIVGDISVSKIEIVDGRNGKRYSITEKEKIQQFIHLLNEREYKEIKNHEKTKGFVYASVLYCDNKEFYITFLDDEIEINDSYFSLNMPILEKDISNLLK
ncbi:hypothetical protein KHA93_01220 [Bacillus sp. FJAT-49732]|uniref:Uncharacterized protein n=1 Tax=Lederbergia citrisecunda TaxID=2833583 RepID=A0A942TIJ1_9BACI|nr:hypothetical protein [Lederbergia citrisecunda]MBS4198280.1 hypothetical protein [Lederbergia citrisecunda]